MINLGEIIQETEVGKQETEDWRQKTGAGDRRLETGVTIKSISYLYQSDE